MALHLPIAPGSSFVQKTWYDSLLDTYASLDTTTSSGPFYQPGSLVLNSEARTRAQTSIISDLRHMFARSSWWFSFIHVPSFWANFHSPERRSSSELQPGLLLSALAMAIFFKSNEAEGGAWGRERAARIKAEAEAAVESSLAVGWIDVGLAQAAWVRTILAVDTADAYIIQFLAMYEINPHPYHSLQKTRSALSRLDNIIRLLKCNSIDTDNPIVTRFDSKAMPAAQHQPALTHSTTVYQSGHMLNTGNQVPGLYNQPSNVRGEVAPPSDSVVRWPPGNVSLHTPSHNAETMGHSLIHQRTECRCQEICLGNTVPESKTHTPLWHYTANWAREFEPGEVRREEARRIVWAFVTLSSSFAGHTATLGTGKASDVFWSACAENVIIRVLHSSCTR